MTVVARHQMMTEVLEVWSLGLHRNGRLSVGCARDIVEDLGLVPQRGVPHEAWPELHQFANFTPESLRNELDLAENKLLAPTADIDQAVALIPRGMLRIVSAHLCYDRLHEGGRQPLHLEQSPKERM